MMKVFKQCGKMVLIISDGKYMNIDHNAEIVHIDAPQDAEIIKLGQQLNKTYIAFGNSGREKKELQAEQDAEFYES